MQAIVVHEFGGPEVLDYEEVPQPEPGPDQVRVKIEAAGVNMVDIYNRRGPGELPFTPGMEGAGVIDAIGSGVTHVTLGERVAYNMQRGSYAQYAVVPAWQLMPIPTDVSVRQAAAVVLQGMTAHYLCHDAYPVKPGDTALIHAAAGGVGALLVQMAKRQGARVFGTVSTEEKAQVAREAGVDEVILYTETDFQEEVMRLTEGQGVNVVYDSVGKTTFDKSLNCLQPRSYLILFGASSGWPSVDPKALAKRSTYLTRPGLPHYAGNRAEVLRRADDLFGWMATGELKVRIDIEYPLAQASEAHEYMENRRSKGKLLLLPASV